MGAAERVARALAAAARLSDPADPLHREASERLPAETGLHPRVVADALAWCIEREVSAKGLAALLSAPPPARRAHVVLSGNVFVAPVRALALAWASAPAASLRPSRRSRVVPELLARALDEAGGEGEIELVDALSAQPGDCVHAYGSDATLEAIRASLPPGVGFWGHGHGFGVAAVDAATAPGAARALAVDVARFDQRGCLSPRVVFSMAADEGQSEVFARELHQALEGAAAALPLGAVDEAEQAERRRYLATIEAVGLALCGSTAAVGLQAEPEGLLVPSFPRGVHVVHVSSVRQAARLLAAVEPWVTALGGEGEAAEGLAEAAPRARRAALGQMQTPPLDGPVDLRTRTCLSSRAVKKKPTSAPLQVPSHARIHERGDARLDAVLDFVAWSARPMPLVSLLDEAPRRLAAIVHADVTSLYLLEGDGETLVMRGNVGFPERALGQVRLKLGEGITGTAVQILRPISVMAAPSHDNFRNFPELDEGRFPVFCAVPIVGRKGPLGAVVAQRKGHEPFADADVELLIALSATISAAVRAAELTDAARDRHPLPRKAGGGTRKVVLPGRPMLPGRVVGAVAAIKRPPRRPRDVRHGDDVERLQGAFELADRTIQTLQARARAMELPGTGFLDTYAVIASDARLRKEAIRLCKEGMGVAESLGNIARRVAAAAVAERSSFLEERARDIEDLCDALVMLAASDPRAEMPAKAVMVADQLTVFDVLLSTRWKPVGIALAEITQSPRTLVLLRLLGLPAVSDVGGLFRWASDGDVALLDGDHGLFILNPSRSEVASVREETKQKSRSKLSLAMARDSRPPGFDMAYRPLHAQRFGPSTRSCLWAYGYGSLSLLFAAFVFAGYHAPRSSWLYESVVLNSNRSMPPITFAMIVLGSGLAAVIQAHMRGVILHPDGIETFEFALLGLPRVRRFDWPVIDRFRFDTQSAIALDLWDGTHQFLPEVDDRDGLVRALAFVAAARAIPSTGAPEIEDC